MINKLPERPSSPPPVAEPFGPPRVSEQTSDHTFGTWNHLVIVVWKHETTVSALRGSGALVRALAKERGFPVGLLTIVEDGAPLPSTEARKVAAEVLHGVPIKLSAMVFEGQGFRAASVRGVITGIGLLARTPYPHRTFATVKDAAIWIEKETHADDTRAMLRSGIAGAVGKLRL
jgi:hypothetical protein